MVAMNIAEFPAKILPKEYFQKILQGALKKLEEAETSLIGGHTVEGEELKYGLSVVGKIHPEKFYSNSGARIHDKIIITKKLGTGIIATALKADFEVGKSIEEAIFFMTQLNKYTAEILKKFKNVHAVTDITGFGLLGHLLEVLIASGKIANIYFEKVKFIENTIDFADMGLIPEGCYKNRDYFLCKVNFSEKFTELEELLLFNPETSGGFIIFIDESEADKLLEELKKNNIEANIIGEVIDEGEGRVFVK